MIKFISIILLSLLLTSCLRTRSDIGYQRKGYNTPNPTKNTYNVPNLPGSNQQVVNSPKVSTVNKPIAYGGGTSPQDMARLQISLQEINNQIRLLNGRLDVVENKLNSSQNQTSSIDINSKLSNYERALMNLESQVQALRAGGTVSAPAASQSQTKPVFNTPPAKTSVGVKLNAFGRGEKAFREKNWRQAISEYQLYREQYPKGKDYSEATYKIGVCFQELNMKDEAKVFYLEAVTKYPSSRSGKKAKFRLKQL